MCEWHVASLLWQLSTWCISYLALRACTTRPISSVARSGALLTVNSVTGPPSIILLSLKLVERWYYCLITSMCENPQGARFLPPHLPALYERRNCRQLNRLVQLLGLWGGSKVIGMLRCAPDPCASHLHGSGLCQAEVKRKANQTQRFGVNSSRRSQRCKIIIMSSQESSNRCPHHAVQSSLEPKEHQLEPFGAYTAGYPRSLGAHRSELSTSF